MDYHININERFSEFVPYLTDVYFLYEVYKKKGDAVITGELDRYLRDYIEKKSDFVNAGLCKFLGLPKNTPIEIEEESREYVARIKKKE